MTRILDLAVIAVNKSTLQLMLNAVEKYASLAGLKFQLNKCATLTLPDKIDLVYKIYNINLRKFLLSNFYCIDLGVLIEIELKQS